MSNTTLKDNNLTEESVKKLLSKASLRELNIFHDQNQIIVILCKALLKAWKDLETKP